VPLVLIFGLALPAEQMEGENMKRFATFASTLSLVLTLSAAVAFAQNDRRTVQRDKEIAPTPRPQNGPDTRSVQRDRETRQTVAPTPKPQQVPPDGRVVKHDGPETRVPRANGVDFERNPQLKQKVTAMLPRGQTLQQASDGFGGTGQFLATLNASHNLGIPFSALKQKVTSGMSLGQAIHELKPDLNVNDSRKQADKAEQQAKSMQK
jgi:hypothetical protein